MSSTFVFLVVMGLGAIIGSFLNVCIYRIPEGLSIVFPGSHCPRCQAKIHWYQNIPVVSWLALRGRCASCRSRVSVRYPLVEGLTCLLFVLVLYRFGFQWATPVHWLLVSALVVVTFIDLDHQIIPDVISLPGIVVGFLCSFALPWLSWKDSFFGILIGGGTLWLVASGYEWVTKKQGMGGGDVKLLAMIGAFLGWKAIFPIIFFSSLLGTLVGLPLMWVKKADGKLALPFGPFLAAGAFVHIFFGYELIVWYFSVF